MTTQTVAPVKRGEPQLSHGSTTLPAVRAAAVRFVRDDLAWQGGRLAAIPSQDATPQVVRLLKRARRHDVRIAADPAKSVRIASLSTNRYLVMSVVGNFLVDRHGSRWLVVSLPGD